MAEFKETVTKTKDEGVDESGAQVQQQTRKISTEATADSRSTMSNAVWYVVGVLEILLAFRFALKLLGANPTSGVVDFIYTVSGALTGPFDNIFNVTSVTAGDMKSVFEPSILVAMVVYALVAWGLVKLLHLNRTNTQ